MVSSRPWSNDCCIHFVPKQSHSLLDFLIRLQANESLGKRHLLICSALALPQNQKIAGVLTFSAVMDFNLMRVYIDHHERIPDVLKQFMHGRLELKGVYVQDLHDTA